MKVFVIDSKERPCLPTSPRRARKLLDNGKAVVNQVIPFTIKLKRKVNNPIGSFEVGVDDGAKYVGLAIKNSITNEVVFYGCLNHRQDVSRKVEERKNYRKARRFRLRNRHPRFCNRTGSKIPPSIRQRKEAVIRIIKDMMKRLNITKVIVEEVFFNHTLRKCGKFFSLVEIGKKYLKSEIRRLDLIYSTTYGYITKWYRKFLNLSKRHSHDACAIVQSNIINSIEYNIKPKRQKTWESNPTKTCDEKCGFKHYDLVKALYRTRGIVIGSVRSLKRDCITLRTKWCDNFPVSYNKTKLLQRFNGLIYSF